MSLFNKACNCENRVAALEDTVKNMKYYADKSTVDQLMFKLRDSVLGGMSFPLEIIQVIVRQLNELQIKGKK